MSKTERRKIIIASVGKIRDIGKAKVLEFTGEDRVKYETWSEELARLITVGATIDADVEFTENTKDGQTYYHNKVFQIFIDGQPVKTRARGFMSAAQTSLEELASLEDRKRAEIISQLWIAGTLGNTSQEITQLRDWLCQLGRKPAAIVPKTSAPAAKPATKPEPDMVTKSTAKAPEAAPGQFTNAGEFLTACSKPPLKLNKTQVLVALKQACIKAPDSLEGVNFDDAYQVLIDAQKEAKA